MAPNPYIKQYLMTAGPTPVPPAVSQAMATPMLYHRAPAFVELYERVLAKLPEGLPDLQRRADVRGQRLGRDGQAAANLIRPGTKVLACAAGKFGERWIELAEAYGADLVRYEPGWGERLDPAEIDRLLAEGVEVVFATLSETSTGIVNDIQAIAEVVNRHGAILAVDAVSGLGAAELKQDEWGVDVVVAGSPEGADDPARARVRLACPRRRSTSSRRGPAAATTSTGSRPPSPSARATRPSRPRCRCSWASTSRST